MKKEIENKSDVCEFCEGTGEISIDEDDGEGHIQVGIGSKICICSLRDEDDSQE